MTEPLKLTLTLDMDKHLARMVGYDEDGEPCQEPTTIEDVVIGLAANKVVDRILSASRYGTADDPVKELRQTIISQAEELAAARVEQHVEAAFDQVIHQTSDDGSEVFSHTLRDAIVKATEAATKLRPLKERNSMYRENRSVIERLVSEHVDRVVEREVTAEIQKAKDAARAEVSRRATAAIAKVLAP